MDKSLTCITPNQLRWKPLPFPTKEAPKNFIEGLITSSGCGHPAMKVLKFFSVFFLKFSIFLEWDRHLPLFRKRFNA
jgi:homogentisate 1,2-dioxygenase